MDEAFTWPGRDRKRMRRKLRVLLLRNEIWVEWNCDGPEWRGNVRSDEEILELNKEGGACS